MFAGWWQNIQNWYNTAKAWIAHQWDLIWNNTGGRLIRGIADARRLFAGWWANIQNWYNTTRAWIAHIWDLIWNNTAGRLIRGIADARKLFGGWWANIQNWYNTAKTWIGQQWDTIWNNTAGRIIRGVHDIERIFSGWGSWISHFCSVTLPGYFDDAVRGIGKAWDKIEEKVSTPVKWVVQHVYDDLIVPFWNATAGNVGLPKLHKMAEGGVVPGGYSRDDNQLVWMRSGEGVLQPGAVAALGGPQFIDAANRAYGDVPVGSGSPGHYAPGGVVPGRGGALGATNPTGPALGPLAGVVHSIAGVISDIGTGIFDSLASVGTKIVGDTAKLVPGNTGVADAMRAYPPKIWQGFLNWVTSHAPAGNAGDIVKYAESFLGKIPYVWGGTSLSAAGADCSGFTGGDLSHFGYRPPRTSEAQGAWVKRTGPQAGGLAFYHSPGGGADPGHVAIVADANNVVSQGGGMGPKMMGLHGMPLLWTGIPPGGFGGSVGAGTPGHGLVPANASAIAGYLSSHGLDRTAIAGILGNIQQESGGAWGAPGGGLIQWVAGGQPTSLADALAKTMQYIAANGSVADINAHSSTPTEAAVYFSQKYERPGNPQIQNRIAAAIASYAAGYDSGGWLQPGTTLAVNNTGRPELHHLRGPVGCPIQGRARGQGWRATRGDDQHPAAGGWHGRGRVLGVDVPVAGRAAAILDRRQPLRLTSG